ncbi:hypothetical protein CPT03_07580 [Pedobacter ginsengisoli]|uniref:Uncharacterized protein n=1 Tax=Pedobacter ginsengisoli TaxID=363852 RepID=A0A2D1U408_9SPHI|nr:hypothetical protein [Pedobacter ginsengisoli]ATP56341.1 hypothetical protein CPT03_07580 [Pedobacter ginsengisoli]
MKTSWNETQQIEAFIRGTTSPSDAILFEAKLILDDELAEKVRWQKQAYQVVKQYSRQKLREEIETVHQQLFTGHQHLTFSQKIKQLFSKL